MEARNIAEDKDIDYEQLHKEELERFIANRKKKGLIGNQFDALPPNVVNEDAFFALNEAQLTDPNFEKRQVNTDQTTNQGVYITTEVDNNNMSQNLDNLFLEDKCEEMSDKITDVEACKKIRNEMQSALKKAGCKCKHKGIRNSHLNRFRKLIKEEE